LNLPQEENKMRLTSKPLGLIVLAVVFGGIAFSAWMGWWQTESTKIPVKFSEGAASGNYNPADIRGSYTFGDVSELFEIPLADLQQAFLLPEGDVTGLGVKELEAMYADAAANGTEIGTGSIRLFTAFYKNLPFDTAEEYLPAPAVRILKEQGNLSEDRLAYLENHVVSMELLGGTNSNLNPEASSETPSEVVSGPVLENEDHIESEDRVIKGKTTFRDVLDWGVPQETIETVLGQSMPSPLLAIKDFCLEQGLEFGTIKEALQLKVEPLE
jgi:hypothetical protein